MKNILSIAALLAISFHVNAQENVKFGVKAGANFSTLSNVTKAEMLPGFYAGAVAEIKLSKAFSFQPELVYSSQGAKNVYSETVGGVTVNHSNQDKLGYINVPLLAKYYITKSFSAEVGPQLGFMVSAQNNDKVTTNNVEVRENRSFKDEVKSFDFGIGAGLSYDVIKGFFVNARYNFGLTKVGKANEYYSQSKNGITQVGIGYKF